MTSTPDAVVRAYRLQRLRTAALGGAPALLYLVAATALGADAQALRLGIALFVVASVAVYLGRPFARGVPVGLLLGIVPFATATVAQGAGHVCLDGACMAVCAPACTASGVVAGLLGTALTVRLRGGLHAFAPMATMLVLAGGMGCRCLGYGSMLGLCAGLVSASVPFWPRLWADTRAAASS